MSTTSEPSADLLHRFIDQHIYNGAPGKGQALYNDGGNPWLHDQVADFLADQALAANALVTDERTKK